MQVFLFKHLGNKRRGEGEGPVDFENIIVLDAAEKSVRKAEVKVRGLRGRVKRLGLPFMACLACESNTWVGVWNSGF